VAYGGVQLEIFAFLGDRAYQETTRKLALCTEIRDPLKSQTGRLPDSLTSKGDGGSKGGRKSAEFIVEGPRNLRLLDEGGKRVMTTSFHPISSHAGNRHRGMKGTHLQSAKSGTRDYRKDFTRLHRGLITTKWKEAGAGGRGEGY